ncbi:hypothetical protein ABPG77_008283 [Micractinium sp. CCAP 211/92]
MRRHSNSPKSGEEGVGRGFGDFGFSTPHARHPQSQADYKEQIEYPLPTVAERCAPASSSKSLLSQRQLFWLCVLLGCGVLLVSSPALLRHGLTPPWHSVLLTGCPAASQSPRRLELPWKPLLTPEEQRRGISYYGSGRALHRVATKLLAGQPIKAYALGGSITGGGGSSNYNKTAYVPRFFQFIRHNFPNRGHVLENKGIAASTAFIYAACLNHHVPLDADLVTLEFTVNEQWDAKYNSTERRSFEQLLRRLLARKRPPAVVILHHYAWWYSPGDGVDRGLFYREPESALSVFSNYYDIVTLSLRSAAYHLLRAGVDKFKVHRVALGDALHYFLTGPGNWTLGKIPQAGPAQRKSFFYVDSTHPADPGHQVLAELLAGPLSRAVWEATTGGALTEEERRHDPAVPALPPPMIPHSSDEVPGMCAMLEEFKPVVKRQSGFKYMPERPGADSFVKQKWGWRATEPGSWAELEVDSRPGSGAIGANASNAVVWLSYLRSYEGMGTANVTCVSGCACNSTLLDGTWERRASLFTITRFEVSHHEECRFRVTVLEEPGTVPQKGHKVVLVAVMVTHIPFDLKGLSGGSIGMVQNIGLSSDVGF